MSSVYWLWVQVVFWISILLSAVDFFLYLGSLFLLLFCRKQRNWRIISVQLIGFGYLAFGAWAVWNKKTCGNIEEATVAQSISYSFDNLFHWIACFIYLKAAIVMPYLFDKNFYTDNA